MKFEEFIDGVVRSTLEPTPGTHSLEIWKAKLRLKQHTCVPVHRANEMYISPSLLARKKGRKPYKKSIATQHLSMNDKTLNAIYTM